jgi:hypothetical protein
MELHILREESRGTRAGWRAAVHPICGIHFHVRLQISEASSYSFDARWTCAPGPSFCGIRLCLDEQHTPVTSPRSLMPKPSLSLPMR